MAYEKKLRLKMMDRKGEPKSMAIRADEDVTEEALLAIAELSYCGCDGYVETTETVFEEPQDVVVNALVENDGDFKAILGFKGAEGNFKISWPAPKINIEAGFIVRWGSERAEIPAAKVGEEVGNDGTDVAALVATATGDETVVFRSGHIYKRP
jgi:hypothetical protein